ncbi:uncharacterized protein LOC121397561 isoform X3 [Xenopus laevis]|uniref:Uncharacterized protein LOC121397561 isoform X3 n=1 Tax=Xenopus laevis TaxID=8355 RepID=A0A8J1LME1_XENLA|nr:uncharacterized protein LOC121397561 isoform X3 [Xenopus laevis]
MPIEGEGAGNRSRAPTKENGGWRQNPPQTNLGPGTQDLSQGGEGTPGPGEQVVTRIFKPQDTGASHSGLGSMTNGKMMTLAILSRNTITRMIVSFFPASSHGHRQRRPVKGMWQEDIGYGNNRVPSFYFRNREEEESWIQWRKEREQKGEEEAGPSRRQEGRERASSSTEGQSSQNGDRTKVPTRKTTMGKEQEDTKRRCSRVSSNRSPLWGQEGIFHQAANWPKKHLSFLPSSGAPLSV